MKDPIRIESAMKEQPPIQEAKILACLQEQYGLTVTGLEFLPLGYDSHAGVYKVEANEGAFFLKVKSLHVDEITVLLPGYLQEQGLERVIAPLPAKNQEFWCKIESFTLILYPFIEGRSGWGLALSDEQWASYGAALKKLHSVCLSHDLRKRIHKETFIPNKKWADIVKKLHAEVPETSYDDPYQKQLAAFWLEKYDEIGKIVRRAEQIGRVLQRKTLDFVLTHGDIHTGNLLVEKDGQLFLVDWDEAALAPKERDLMFVVAGGFVNDIESERLFFRGYGETTIDPLVLAYYRYARVVEDLGAFAEDVFYRDTSDATKEDSIYWFRVQFSPGGLIEAAHALDDVLPLLS